MKVPNRGQYIKSTLAQKMASVSDLDQFRDRIQRLYIVQGRTLNDVMEILAHEGCNASRNMYLKKLTAWGMKKSRKSTPKPNIFDNLFQIFSKIQGQQTIDPSEVFHLQGGRRVTAGEVLDHFQRTVFPPNSLERSWKIPDSQQLLFQSVYNLQTWALQHQTLQETPDIVYLNQQVFQDFQIGTCLIVENGQPKVGGALIERAFQGTRRCIELGNYKLIWNLINLLTILGVKTPSIAEMLARYMFQASKIIYHPNHVFTNAMSMLYQHWNSFEDTVMALHVCHDVTATILGKYQVQTLQIRYRLLTQLNYRPLAQEQMIETYESLIADCLHAEQTKLALDTKEAYGLYFIRMKDFYRGLAILDEIVDIIHQGPVPPEAHIAFHAAMVATDGLLDLGVLEASTTPQGEQAFVQRYMQAETLIKLAVARATEQFGGDHPTSINCIRVLGEMYRLFGPRYEAEVLAQQQSKEQFDYIERVLQQFTLSG